MENYKRVVETFHKYGIALLGAFVLGNDYESPSYYEELARFLVHSGIDMIQITLLTPLPGTELMKTLEAEGRLVYQNFPNDWEKYRFSYIVHKPNGIEPEIVYIGNNYIKEHLYSFPLYQYRLLNSFISLRNLRNFYASYKSNQAYKKGWKNSHYYKKYPHRFNRAGA